MTSRLAVLGDPIRHSLSPVLHRAAYGVLGLDWEYGRLRVAAGGLRELLAGLGPEWRGLSLTMPLKHEVLSLVDDADEVARRVGAANTLLREGGRQFGFNTDVHGVEQALRDAGAPAPSRIDVIGGGATAASVVTAAAGLGCSEICIVTRTPSRSGSLAALGESLGLRVRLGPLEPLRPGADAVVATLPGGTAVAPELIREAAPGTLLLDVGYDPWPSPLSSVWEAAGGRAVSGLGMLVHQALRQVRIFVNGDPGAGLPDEAAVLRSMAGAVGYGEVTSHS